MWPMISVLWISSFGGLSQAAVETVGGLGTRPLQRFGARGDRGQRFAFVGSRRRHIVVGRPRDSHQPASLSGGPTARSASTDESRFLAGVRFSEPPLETPTRKPDDRQVVRARRCVLYVRALSSSDRPNPSTTSTTTRAKCRCGSHSSTEGGSKNPVSRLIGRKLLMARHPSGNTAHDY